MIAARVVLVATVLLAAAASAAAVSAQVAGQDMLQANGATLRALDTLNGTTRDLPLGVGETARFGQLEITLGACRTPRGAPEANASAFLSIRDLREAAPRFAGWMFASSPALSALDHPRYDVWVLSCSNP